MTATSVLQKYWGYPSFRSGQLEIVNSILSGQDTLALLPTGGGKSVCFQVPGLVMGGVTLVISPLISLMTDQVQQLQKRGVSAVFLSSTLSQSEKQQHEKNILQGRYNFIYVAPERLSQESFVTLCRKIPIRLVAIDEAHCCSEWGHDFRPSYLKIAHFIKTMPKKPVVAAFTATATEKTVKDIIKLIGLHQPIIFKNPSKRSNLFLSIHNCHNSAWQWWYLTYALSKIPNATPAIIYSSTQSATEFYTKLLSGFLPHLAFGTYHAGLPTKLKNQVQESFIENDIDVICATSAFGMGVDKPNIRQVLRTHPSLSIEAYVQEVGRAGRDGQPAKATLFYHSQSITTTEKLITTKRLKQKFSSLKRFISQTTICRHQYLTHYFDGIPFNHSVACNQCDVCTEPYWQPTQKIKNLYKKILPSETPLNRHWEVLRTL